MTYFDEQDLEVNSEINYMKEAFLHQFNVISLAGLAGLGLFVPGVWFMTVAAEMMYLAMVPSNKRFQRSVRAELNSASKLAIEESDTHILAKLPNRSRKRYHDLQVICAKIREVVETVDSSSRIMIDQDIEKLDYLLKTFLRMLTALARQRDHLASVDRNSINRNIKRLKKQAQAASQRVKVIKQKNIDILHQRLNRIGRVVEDQELILANLETIEDTLKLIRDNVASINTHPEGISNQIESVVVNMQENEKLMESMSSFLDNPTAQVQAPASDQIDIANQMPSSVNTVTNSSKAESEQVIRIE